MIIGELTAGVRILLEKGLSRYNISKDQQFLENTQKFLFCQKTEVARRRGRDNPPGTHTTPRRGPALAHLCQCPFVYIIFPKTYVVGMTSGACQGPSYLPAGILGISTALG
jgi:hypothetical protein